MKAELNAEKVLKEKPFGWEYQYAAALLSNQVRSIRISFDALLSGSTFVKSRSVGRAGFLSFASAKGEDAGRLVDSFSALLEHELTPAFGPPGVPGEPSVIRSAVDKLADVARHLLKWEQQVRAVVPPPDFAKAHALMHGWGEYAFRAIETFATEFEAKAARVAVTHDIQITAKFDPPPQMKEFTREMDRLRCGVTWGRLSPVSVIRSVLAILGLRSLFSGRRRRRF